MIDNKYIKTLEGTVFISSIYLAKLIKIDHFDWLKSVYKVELEDSDDYSPFFLNEETAKKDLISYCSLVKDYDDDGFYLEIMSNAFELATLQIKEEVIEPPRALLVARQILEIKQCLLDEPEPIKRFLFMECLRETYKDSPSFEKLLSPLVWAEPEDMGHIIKGSFRAEDLEALKKLKNDGGRLVDRI